MFGVLKSQVQYEVIPEDVNRNYGIEGLTCHLNGVVG